MNFVHDPQVFIFLTKKIVNFQNTPKFQARNWILMIYFLLLHRSHRRLSSLWRRQRRFWKLHRFQKKRNHCQHRYLKELWNGWIDRRLTNKLKEGLINGRKLWNISEWWAVPESFFYFLILLIDFFPPPFYINSGRTFELSAAISMYGPCFQFRTHSEFKVGQYIFAFESDSRLNL